MIKGCQEGLILGIFWLVFAPFFLVEVFQTVIILSDDVENHRFPIVNTLLIIANCLIFVVLFQQNVTDSFYREWGTVPLRFFAHHDLHELFRSLSSTFLHGGWMHLIGNMWALYLFGDNVEDRLGHFTYLVFYLACGVFADLINVMSDPFSTIPTIGASGAIAGVMGAYIAMHPTANCNTWWGDDSLWFAFRTFKIPAVLVIFGWFVLQVVSGMFMEQGVAGVAFYAHIGGFLTGLAILTFIRHEAYTDPQSNTQVTNVPFLSVTGVVCLIMLFVYLANPGAHGGKESTISSAAPASAVPTQKEKPPAAAPSFHLEPPHKAPVKIAHPSAGSHHHASGKQPGRTSSKHNL